MQKRWGKPPKAATKRKQKVESRKQKGAQSHTGAKAEGRMMNAEVPSKSTQSRAQAKCKPGDWDVLSIVPLLVLYWSSIGPLLMVVFFRLAFGGHAGSRPQLCLGQSAMGWSLFE